MRWWELPGPLSFATEVVDDLRQGKNVIVCLPAHTPDGLRPVARRVFGIEESWRTIRGKDIDENTPRLAL